MSKIEIDGVVYDIPPVPLDRVLEQLPKPGTPQAERLFNAIIANMTPGVLRILPCDAETPAKDET